MASLITLKGIDQAISNLNYGEMKTLGIGLLRLSGSSMRAKAQLNR